MEKLEWRTMQAIRAELLTCDARRLRQVWDEASNVKGGNERVVFETSIRRDVIAHIMMRVMLDCFEGTVFGGFLQAHYTGLPWSDIDVAIDGAQNIAKIWNASIEFVRFVLGIDAFSFSTQKQKCLSYGVTYEFQYEDIVVSVDLVNARLLETTNATMFMPCRIGSYD